MSYCPSETKIGRNEKWLVAVEIKNSVTCSIGESVSIDQVWVVSLKSNLSPDISNKWLAGGFYFFTLLSILSFLDSVNVLFHNWRHNIMVFWKMCTLKNWLAKLPEKNWVRHWWTQQHFPCTTCPINHFDGNPSVFAHGCVDLKNNWQEQMMSIEVGSGSFKDEIMFPWLKVCTYDWFLSSLPFVVNNPWL